MNWRVLVGLLLLLIGVKVLYTAIAGSEAAAAVGVSVLYAKIGSVVWIGVGLYFLVKGMTRNEPKL
jgi:hypothetical protein